MKGPLTLIILDGWGIAQPGEGNAISLANTPNMDGFVAKYPHTELSCSGEDVGLPGGQMGNSEVGHLNMGSGRVVYQELTRISKAVREGDFFTNRQLLSAIENAKKNNTSLHLMGLLSDGGVHSHIDHLFALLDLAAENNIDKLFVHCFLDGRDVPPRSAVRYIKQLETKLKELGTGKIASVGGRYYGMDRDKRWERVELAYLALTAGQGPKFSSAEEAVSASYSREESDEFVKPSVITDLGGRPLGIIGPGDSVIFFNFRPDRGRQITRAFTDREFTGFSRMLPEKLHFVSMTQYDKTIRIPVAFEPQQLENTLGQVLSRAGIRQLRMAETEKYAHVTFFFNGGVEAPEEGEERVLIPSPKVATYDLKPEMSALVMTEELVRQISLKAHKVIVVNYANPDMVGHTGNINSAVKAIETVDYCLGQVVNSILAEDGAVIITADHGNAEAMKDTQGNPLTAHTTFPVPLILIGRELSSVGLAKGSLQDVAPTILDLLDLEQPREMTGKSLII
ncbi:MAG: 2,3-bisphosphoglycerate-independent phosphoglycerate mutase [Peptococcaceae bacterium]|nr:2,3-bisphosphoglycerate-independent phosphoglycerate mutase [Peptococcaceae bacterium]